MMGDIVNIGDILKLLKEKYKLILGITMSFICIVGILSFFVITPKYEAKVKLFIGKEKSKEDTGYNSTEVQMYQKLLTTYAEIIKTRDLVKASVKNIDLEKKDVEDVLENLVVTPRNDTQILEISYKDTSAERTLAVVNEITEKFILKSKELIQNGNVQIVEEAVYPDKPVSPNKKMNMAMAAILGLMAGIILVIVRELLDNTFKSKEELEKFLKLPVIGAIPEYDSEEIQSIELDSTSRSERKKLKSRTA